MSLRELTKEAHMNAERTAFVSEMMSGEIDKEKYATFLYNLAKQYQILEQVASGLGIFVELPGLQRYEMIWQDFLELWPQGKIFPESLPVTQEYKSYILKEIQTSHDRVMAHVYTRHMGDMSGGQMLKKKVPGEGRMYNFNFEIPQMKEKLRTKLHDGMADEANVCFNFAIKTFEQVNG